MAEDIFKDGGETTITWYNHFIYKNSACNGITGNVKNIWLVTQIDIPSVTQWKPTAGVAAAEFCKQNTSQCS